MKTEIVDIDFDSEFGVTVVTLKTPLGFFYGSSQINKDVDTLPPSQMIGGRIAEGRAYINFYNTLLENKRYELKGIKRLLNSSSPDKAGYNHILKMYDVIYNEYIELKRDKLAYQQDIKSAINGRAMYLRSRTEDKKAKKEKLDALGNAIKALGQNNSKE